MRFTKAVLAALFVCFSGVAFGQSSYTTITASHITDAGGNAMAAGNLCFTPTDGLGNALAFHVGGVTAGSGVSAPVCVSVSAGALPSGFQLADTSQTVPANICYKVTFTDNTQGLVGTYNCIQPSGSVWSLDTYNPSGSSLGLSLGVNSLNSLIGGLSIVPGPSGNVSVSSSGNTITIDAIGGGGGGGGITALTGDVTGSGTGSVTTTLATVNANVGTFPKVTVNAKGLITAATSLVASDLPSTAVTPGSYTSPNLTIDAQGRITSAANGSGCLTCVTSAAALTSNRLMIGGGLEASSTLGSSGTTTTVLHGNAAGAPSFGPVALTTDISGNLPVANLNSGTSASSTTFWRGDGTWATPTVTGGVSSFNTATGAVTITAGSNITITPSGSNFAIAATGTVSSPTQRGVDAVADLGLDNTGATDCGTTLSSYVNSTMAAGGGTIYFPPGKYKFTNSWHITANKPLSIEGAGKAAHTGTGSASDGETIFQSNQAINILWFDSTGITSMEQGPSIKHIYFTDNSASQNTVISGLRLTGIQNWITDDLTFAGFQGASYTTGTVSISNGQRNVTGSGTTFTSAMNGGILYIGGKPHQINPAPIQQLGLTPNATTIYLTDTYQDTTCSGCAYEIDYNGYGYLMDPGTGNPGGANFAQYGTALNTNAWKTQFPVYAMGGSSAAYGVSRVKFFGGFINCNQVADSIALTLGGYTDTIDFNVAVNNCTVGAYMEQAHGNRITGANFEVASGAYASSPTCPAQIAAGGTVQQACSYGVMIRGSSGSHNRMNMITGTEFGAMGTGIDVGAAVSNLSIIGNDYASNTHDIAMPSSGNAGFDTTYIGESSVGVSINGAANVLMSNKSPNGSRVGNASFTSGTSLPATCAVGDMYLKTNGGTTTTLNICTATNTWTGK